MMTNWIQLDTGSEERVMLQSQDEQNVILVTYSDLKKALGKVRQSKLLLRMMRNNLFELTNHNTSLSMPFHNLVLWLVDSNNANHQFRHRIFSSKIVFVENHFGRKNFRRK